ncbi:hypothetical protein AVK37_10230 [Listeria monocytogenes]|nr:hypothetical protein [Listeria monocytogenes]EAC6519764.1 hypothetical protein [Listeria monocytogenes serotype 4b]EAF4527112.1 hypothetical protein [Listeria monocytogenes serotype 1/2a]EAA0398088.1 hypothetical protein [Listeria monocytogenes]EAC2278277.1 hypothetical protein [Listeria monocytogenes]
MYLLHIAKKRHAYFPVFREMKHGVFLCSLYLNLESMIFLKNEKYANKYTFTYVPFSCRR